MIKVTRLPNTNLKCAAKAHLDDALEGLNFEVRMAVFDVRNVGALGSDSVGYVELAEAKFFAKLSELAAQDFAKVRFKRNTQLAHRICPKAVSGLRHINKLNEGPHDIKVERSLRPLKRAPFINAHWSARQGFAQLLFGGTQVEQPPFRTLKRDNQIVLIPNLHRGELRKLGKTFTHGAVG